MNSTINTVLLSSIVGAVVALVADQIRARVAGKWWVAQEQWKLKRETYVRLLENLWELSDSFRQQLTLETTSSPNDPGHPGVVAKQQRRYARAQEDLQKGRGALPLLLRDETLRALDELDQADAIGCPAPYLDAIKRVYEDVLASAAKDLRLRP
jgi:hypothetical protein